MLSYVPTVVTDTGAHTHGLPRPRQPTQRSAARACPTLYGQRQRHAGLFDAQSISHSSDDASSGGSSHTH